MTRASAPFKEAARSAGVAVAMFAVKMDASGTPRAVTFALLCG